MRSLTMIINDNVQSDARNEFETYTLFLFTPSISVPDPHLQLGKYRRTPILKIHRVNIILKYVFRYLF